jgi:hypothetical protein
MVPPSTARPRDPNEERLYSQAGRRSLVGEDSGAARLEVAKERLVPGLDGRLLPRPRRLEARAGRGPAAGAARAARAPGQRLLARGARDVLGLLDLGEPRPAELAPGVARVAAVKVELADGAEGGERPRQERERSAHHARGVGTDDTVRGVGSDPVGAIRPTTSSAATTATRARHGKTRTTTRFTATGPSQANLLRPSARGQVSWKERHGRP